VEHGRYATLDELLSDSTGGMVRSRLSEADSRALRAFLEGL
jgi:hypothetical protein